VKAPGPIGASPGGVSGSFLDRRSGSVSAVGLAWAPLQSRGTPLARARSIQVRGCGGPPPLLCTRGAKAPAADVLVVRITAPAAFVIDTVSYEQVGTKTPVAAGVRG
jgi:hypothetical protein